MSDTDKKVYLGAAVISIVISVACHLFLGANTEAEVWKKTSIQAIVDVSQATITNQRQAKAQQRLSEVLNNIKKDFEALNDLKVDEVLQKYFKK